MRKYLFGTSALALSASTMFTPITSSSMSAVPHHQLEQKLVRISTIGNNKSSSVETKNLVTKVFNWHAFSNDLLGNSRDFTDEEIIMHSNSIKRISMDKGKKFEI